LRFRPMMVTAVGCLFVFVQVAAAAPQNGECDLPRDLQPEIASKYPGLKLVTLSDLQEDDRGFFQKDHGNSCPGLVKVDFYGDGKPTLALVLISKDRSKLIVAHQVGENWRTTVLGKEVHLCPWYGAYHRASTPTFMGRSQFERLDPSSFFCVRVLGHPLCVDRKRCQQDLDCRLTSIGNNPHGRLTGKVASAKR